MRKAYQELFDGVRASDRLKMEVMNMKREETKRIRRIPRAALAAAVLVLALAGTALAAEYFGWVKLRTLGPEEMQGAETLSGYLAEAEYERIPLENLAGEALRRAAAIPAPEEGGWYGEAWRFDSWTEAEEFLGLELADNPVLEGMEKADHSFGYGEAYAEGPCLAIVDTDHGTPAWISVMARYQEGDCEVLQAAHPQFDVPAGKESGRALAGANAHIEGYGEYRTEQYVTPGGMEVQLAVSDGHQAAYFVHNGVLFELVVDGGATHAQTLLKEILDAYN